MPEVVNPYSDLVQLMRKQGSVYNPPAIQLAKVLTPPPNLTIQTGDIQIDKDNILISESLLSTFSRKCKIKGTFDPEKDSMSFTASNVGNTSSASVGDHGSHSHSIPSISVNSSSGFTGNIEAEFTIDFTDTLKKNDIVAVIPTEDRQTYIILSRLVKADYKY